MKICARKLSFLIVFVFLIIALVGCEKTYYNRIWLVDAFQTQSYVDVFTKSPLSEAELEKLQDEMNGILIGLDNTFNIQPRGTEEPDTLLYKIGKKAGVEPVAVTDDVIYVLKKALELSEISKTEIGGEEVALFDPTIAPASKAWDFPKNQFTSDPLNPNYLSEEEIAEIVQQVSGIISEGLVDYRKIVIDEEGKTVFLEKAGMEIDLGAIAKGFAADKIKEYLVGRGYASAIINIGGNVLLVGNLNGDDFRIDIRTPYINFLNARYDKDGNIINETFGGVFLTDLSIVTSGTYEKYIEDVKGNQYHHILNPRTGMPINNGVISITVITKNSTLADGYSTTLFALGLERGMEIVEATEDLETVWVVRNGSAKEIYISAGLEGKFKFNNNVIDDGFVFKGVYGHENTQN